MRVLVTGGAGYIGAHACKALAAAGHEPIVYDNLRTGHRDFVRWGAFEHGDIRDRSRLEEVLREHDVAAVIHFAALAYVGESVSRPDLYYDVNVGGTLSLLGAMRSCGIDRIVFSSTCATYGEPDQVPITEDSRQSPVNPYGHSKLMVEQMLADHAAAFGIGSVALRYFNAAGADPDGEIGEEHDPETHLIPLVLQAAADPSRSVTVFGTDYDTPDGSCIRDYIHVADLAAAHVRALEAATPGIAAHFNLGTGRGTSVREIIALCERITGKPIAVREGPRRAGDPPALVADPGRARTDLSWEARYDAEAMIASAWAWMRRNR